MGKEITLEMVVKTCGSESMAKEIIKARERIKAQLAEQRRKEIEQLIDREYRSWRTE
jgi:hypothetical protein